MTTTVLLCLPGSVNVRIRPNGKKRQADTLIMLGLMVVTLRNKRIVISRTLVKTFPDDTVATVIPATAPSPGSPPTLRPPPSQSPFLSFVTVGCARVSSHYYI
ncbi:hypothetical protein E2C01_058993 [Portunus trituberculatus]|uniref:Uncharacterized protein n=1 Tax=Portunus trituberculatus TaxID=210409 RepID=A0A5B7GX07_PORTR|nr:hypothetical protein [Portunus trituberculatus]